MTAFGALGHDLRYVVTPAMLPPGQPVSRSQSNVAKDQA